MFYVLDDNKNLVEAFDKEGFLALLEQIIEDGSLENIDEDTAVASKLRSIINGTAHHIEFVTQAQYNQLEQDEELVAGTYYFITDDETAEDFAEAIEVLQTDLALAFERIEALELFKNLTNTRLNEQITPVSNTLWSKSDGSDFKIYATKSSYGGTVSYPNKLTSGLYAVEVFSNRFYQFYRVSLFIHYYGQMENTADFSIKFYPTAGEPNLMDGVFHLVAMNGGELHLYNASGNEVDIPFTIKAKQIGKTEE